MAALQACSIPDICRRKYEAGPALPRDKGPLADVPICFAQASPKTGGSPLEGPIKKMRGIKSGAILMPRTAGVSDQVGTRGAAKRGEGLAPPKRPVGGGAGGSPL